MNIRSLKPNAFYVKSPPDDINAGDDPYVKYKTVECMDWTAFCWKLVFESPITGTDLTGSDQIFGFFQPLGPTGKTVALSYLTKFKTPPSTRVRWKSKFAVTFGTASTAEQAAQIAYDLAVSTATAEGFLFDPALISSYSFAYSSAWGSYMGIAFVGDRTNTGGDSGAVTDTGEILP